MTAFADALATLGEAFRRTTPTFITIVSLVSILGYGAAFTIHAVTTPITTPTITTIATWTGTALILLAASATAAIHTSLAQSWATYTTPRLSDALDALPATTRILPLLLIAILHTLTFSVFLREPGAYIALTYWLWAGPVITNHIINATDTPLYRAIPQGIMLAIRNYRITIPLTLLAAATLALGIITIIGMLYAIPLIVLAHAIAYRDTHGL